MTRPRYMLFDFGNTLKITDFDRESWISRWLELSDNPLGITTDRVRQVADELIATTALIRKNHSMEFSRRQFENNLCARLGVRFEKSHEELNLEFVDTAYRSDKSTDGVHSMLDHVKSIGITMAVVSNSVLDGNSIIYALEKHGLYEPMEFVMSSADYGFRKPHPQLFRTALFRLNAKPEETWFIGDLLGVDIAGAQSAGLTSVWYNPENQNPGEIVPDLTIRHWNELREILDQLDP